MAAPFSKAVTAFAALFSSKVGHVQDCGSSSTGLEVAAASQRYQPDGSWLIAARMSDEASLNSFIDRVVLEQEYGKSWVPFVDNDEAEQPYASLMQWRYELPEDEVLPALRLRLVDDDDKTGCHDAIVPLDGSVLAEDHGTAMGFAFTRSLETTGAPTPAPAQTTAPAAAQTLSPTAAPTAADRDTFAPTAAPTMMSFTPAPTAADPATSAPTTVMSYTAAPTAAEALTLPPTPTPSAVGVSPSLVRRLSVGEKSDSAKTEGRRVRGSRGRD